MPDVKFTLTAEEKGAIAKLRAVEAEGANIAATCNKATQSVQATEAMLAKLGKGLNFHGKRPTSQVAADLMGRMDIGSAQRIVMRQASEMRRQQTQTGLRGEAERILHALRSNEQRIRAATDSDTRYTARFGDDSVGRGKAKKKLNTFIRENDLGDVDDPVVRRVARVLQRKITRVNQIVTASLAAVGGDTELLTLARAQGVDIGRPKAVQRFVDRRKLDVEYAVISRAEQEVRGANESTAERAAEAKRQENRDRISRVFDENDAAIRTGKERYQRIQGFAESRRSYQTKRKYRAGAGRIYTQGGAAPETPESVSTTPSEGLLAQGMDDVSETRRLGDIERRNLRSNRMAEARDLRKQRNAAIRSKVGSAVGGVAGVAAGSLYALENVLGNYNQRLGVDYFGGLASIEPMFREVMGMSGNAGRQKQLRQAITSMAVAAGRPVPDTAAFTYDVYSSAGNLPDAKQQEIIRSTLMLQSVAGGDLPVLGKAQTTIQQLYGQKIGSVDRASSIIKQTIDYGKFSATGFAGLAPEALSTAAAYGIPFEEAMASLAVASTRSGRDENMFTGARYVFSLMGKAADQGLVTRNAGFIDQLKELRGASQNQLVEVFGREGFNVASNLRDMVGDVDTFSGKLRGTTGREIGVMQQELTRDPVNAMSRLAASVDVAGQNVYQTLIQSGPDGLKLAADALMTNAAMTGQKMMSPDIAALTDITKNKDLNLRKQEYASRVLTGVRGDLMKNDSPASRQMIAAMDLMSGKVQVGETLVSAGSNAMGPGGYSTTKVKVPRMSTGEDIQKYADLMKNEGIKNLTASEYGRVALARERGDETEAKRLLTYFRNRPSPQGGEERGFGSSVAASFGMVGGLALKGVKAGATTALGALPDALKSRLATGLKGIQSQLPSATQFEDNINRGMIAGELKRQQELFNKGKAENNLAVMDSARSRINSIRDRVDELAYDDDGYTFTDRRQVVSELFPTGTPNAGFGDAVGVFAKAIGDLVLVLKELPKNAGAQPAGPAGQSTGTSATSQAPATQLGQPRSPSAPPNP